MDYWIWLSQLPGVGSILQKRLLEVFGSPKNIHKASVLDLIEVEGIGKQIAEKIVQFRVNEVSQILTNIEKLGLQVVTIENKIYADVFACKQTPILFYYRGRLPPARGMAIVGARRCTYEAKQATEEIATFIAQNPLSVISGLAKGVDSYAHTSSLKVGGHTTAILANGVDICYPKEHLRLFREIIARNGAIVSAHPPGTRPHPKFFVERNAHISAWSTDVIVVQASEKSGSLTTARFALEQGRNLFVVPHSIYVTEARGSNQLLEKGANPYLGSHSLKLEGLQPSSGSLVEHFPATPPQHSPLEKSIICYLRNVQTITVEALAQHLQLSEVNLSPVLLTLEMNGYIKVRGTSISPTSLLVDQQ
ncbi:MAG: DNA-processing protein DprA [Anaerobacillus sp.]|uniref:DNA-processing protein DprA n=1 Tax=Anaerobacillus sp. TaxID=1872506 RepID=UPI0039187408